MTGIGLGWACENERKGFSWLPLGGLGLAILLHGAWNLTAAIHAKLWLLTYALFMLPCAVGVIVVLRCALERKGAWLRRYFEERDAGPRVGQGLLDPRASGLLARKSAPPGSPWLVSQ